MKSQKGGTFLEIILTMLFVIIFSLCCLYGVRIINSVEQRGLRKTIERVWEGPKIKNE